MQQRPRKRSGRPPAGIRPGERVSDYPQLSTRIPVETYDRLQALATLHGIPQWRVLSDALDALVKELSADEQALLQELMRRAEPILQQPAKSRLPAGIEPAAVKILNVDDNEPMLFARSSVLRGEGFHVIEAQTGRDALDLFDEHRPQLVVLDVNLPDMSGLDVCRQMKAIAGVKVVQTSATFSTPHDQLEGLEAGGADIYLAEPVPRGTLLSIVRRLLEPGLPPRSVS